MPHTVPPIPDVSGGSARHDASDWQYDAGATAPSKDCNVAVRYTITAFLMGTSTYAPTYPAVVPPRSFRPSRKEQKKSEGNTADGRAQKAQFAPATYGSSNSTAARSRREMLEVDRRPLDGCAAPHSGPIAHLCRCSRRDIESRRLPFGGGASDRSRSQLSECDCCGRPDLPLRQVWFCGLETWACAECRGEDPDDLDDEDDAP